MIAFAQLQGVSLYFISCFNYDISRQSQLLGVFPVGVELCRKCPRRCDWSVELLDSSMMSARGRKVVDPRLWFLALLTWWCLWPLRATSRMWGRKRGSSWLLSTHSSVNLSNQIGITFVKFHKPRKWGGGDIYIQDGRKNVFLFSRNLQCLSST